MRSRAVRHAGRFIGLVVMAGAAGVAQAQDVQTGVIVSAGVSGETNPYSVANSDGFSVAATTEVRPTITVRDERTQVDIRGLAQFRQFLRRYGLEDNYGFDTNITSRRSEKLTLRGSSAFSYNEGGYNSYGRPSLSIIAPIETIPTPSAPAEGAPEATLPSLIDVNILGIRTRVTMINSDVGADVTLGAYASVSVDFDARAMRFESAGYDDYNSFRGEFRYNYRLDDLWSIGAIGGVGKTNYLDPGQGDATSYDALVSLDRRLGSRWSLSLAGGASFTDIEARAGQPAVHYTSASARARFCRQGQYSLLCIGGQRSPQPAANGSVRVSDSISADYSLRLSERERFTLGGSYARTGRGRDLIGAPPLEFVSGSARYDRDITQRIGVFASTSVSKVYSSNAPRRANFGLAIGIQARIGAAR